MLNSLRKWNSKFRREYGELVIAADGLGPSWRKTEFPYYKANRKKDRQGANWEQLHQIVSQFKHELKENLPYPFIEVQHAEADDVIYVLSTRNIKPFLIISSDKDFIQLQVKDWIKIFDPIRERWLSHESPKDFLVEHIVIGDRVDGIPNILSDDDCFANSKRQVIMTEGRKKEAIQKYHDIISGKDIANLKEVRNVRMIDLSMIPTDMKEMIEQRIDGAMAEKKDRMTMRRYFSNHGLNQMIYSLGDF